MSMRQVVVDCARRCRKTTPASRHKLRKRDARDCIYSNLIRIRMKTQTKEEPVIDSKRGKAGRVLLAAGSEGLRDDLRPAAASKKGTRVAVMICLGERRLLRRRHKREGQRCVDGSHCDWKLELLETRRHGLVLIFLARLAPAPYPIVLADARPSALLALAPFPIVLADARPSALLARAPSPSVLADARPSALLAFAPLPSVLADARPSALLALASSPSVLGLGFRV